VVDWDDAIKRSQVRFP